MNRFFRFQKLWKSWIVVIACLLQLSSLKAQNQELEVGLYNIGLGTIIGGIGSFINKPKNEKTLHAIFRGMKYGALGGAGMYLGKKVSYQITNSKSLVFAWPSKILHNAGASIVENAAAHRGNVFEQWNFSVAFMRISFNTEEHLSVSARLMPLSFITFVVACTNSSFSAGESLQYGTPVFRFSYLSDRSKNAVATTEANLVYVVDTLQGENKYQTFAHEHIHILQEREYMNLNTWFKPLYEKPKIKNNNIVSSLAKYIYPDVPYNYAVYGILYRKGDCYFNNFHEFEAERFSTNRYVYRCE